MSQDGIDPRQLLVERRKRLVGTILNYAEREIYPGMSARQQVEFRQKVLDAVGGYHDLMIDLMRSVAGDGVTNQRAIELLEDLHRRWVD